VRKVVEKACKAAAKSTSNHSPAPHGGPNPLCGLVIPDLTPDKDAKGGGGVMHRKEK